MKKAFSKTRRLPAGLLVFMLALTVAFGSVTLYTASADSTTQWLSGSQGALTYDAETELTKIENSAHIVNQTNILEQPDRTVKFQMRVNKSGGWSGIAFLNGLSNWSSVTWPGINTGSDKLPHLIFQDGSMQLYGNNIATLLGSDAVGVTAGSATFSTRLIGITIHIGTGTDGDVSYMMTDTTQLKSEVDSTSALSFMTVNDFPNGCYLGMHLNMDGSSALETYLGKFSSPILTDISDAFTSVSLFAAVTTRHNFTIRGLADPDSAVLKFNGTAVSSEYYTATAPSNDDGTGKRYYIETPFWTSGADFRPLSYFTVEDTNGKASHIVTVISVNPPEWISDAFKLLETIDDTSFSFSYEGSLTGSDVAVYSGVYSGNVDKKLPLTPDTDYTFTVDGNDDYTLTVKKEYLESVIGGYNGRYFQIEFRGSVLKASVYLEQDGEGWLAREIDLADSQNPLTNDGYYITGRLKRMSAESLVPRLYYNKAVNVSKPIFVELGSAVQVDMEWALLQVSDSLKTMDYFSNDTFAEAMLQMIFFGDNRSEIQKIGGFETTSNANYTMTTMKGIVIEIYFGETADDGYVKINGDLVSGKPTKVQADFAGGKAYIGWMYNKNTAGTVSVNVNSNVNAVAVVAPVADENYKMDLAAAADFAVTLASTSGDITVKDARNYTLVSGTDYVYDAGTCKLTLKAGYFSSLPFAKQGTISIWDNENQTGTRFKMVYSSSGMEDSKIVFGVKGSLADFVIDMPAGITVDSLTDTEFQALDVALWSFTGGKLTIKKEAVADEAGVTEFFAVSGQVLYPIYVYVQEFENGGYKAGGSGTVESVSENHDIYSVNGGVSYTFMQAFNFETGITLKVDFQTVTGYYKGGFNADATYVKFAFYDPYSGYTLYYTLYCNYPDGEVTATDTALYESYSLYDSEGNSVILPVSRGINISGSFNTSASGVHSVSFIFKDGELLITKDNYRVTKIVADELRDFNLSASVLTIETPTAVSGTETELEIQYYHGVVDIDKTEPQPTGCKNTSSSAVFAITILLASLVIRRKR